MEQTTKLDQALETPEETLDGLKILFEEQGREKVLFEMKKERLEDLMKRKGAKKWKPRKAAKMVKRLMAATKGFERSDDVLQTVAHRLTQNGIQASA